MKWEIAQYPSMSQERIHATSLRRIYSLYLDNRALDNSSFLLIVQNLVSPEWNGLSHSKIVLVNRSRYSG